MTDRKWKFDLGPKTGGGPYAEEWYHSCPSCAGVNSETATGISTAMYPEIGKCPACGSDNIGSDVKRHWVAVARKGILTAVIENFCWDCGTPWRTSIDMVRWCTMCGTEYRIGGLTVAQGYRPEWRDLEEEA